MKLVRSLLGAAAAVAVLAVGAQAQTLGCEVGVANGGPIPATGSGGGTGTSFPTVLPPTPGVYTLNVASLPPGASVVTEVKLNGLTHTWVNDVHFVLDDPSGARHNLFVRRAGSCDFGGDYVIVPACTGGLAWPATCSGATIVAPGAYDQFFGTWPSGTNSIFNTPLNSIAAATGTWTLTAYDWVGGDFGNLTSFDVCFGTPTPPAAPTSAPVLGSPADLASVTNPPTLTWAAVDCASTYDVDVDGVVTTGIAGLSFVTPLLSVGAHTWTVRAVNVTGAGPWAATRTFTALGPPPASTCVPNGAGAGAVPASGSGGTGALWPTTLPATPYVNTYNVTLPPGATQLVKVDLDWAVQHTWIGDLQVVLTDPTGGMHNILHRVGHIGTGTGLNCDLNGNYSIYESAGLSWPTVCPASTDLPPGDYNQAFSSWTSGDLGIFNTPLSAIPISNGNWTLTIYDWVSGDSGSLADWRLCFDTGPAGPVTFCTAGTSTSGCVASLTANVQPNVSNTAGCVLTATNVDGQRLGLLFYGINNTGYTPTVWGPGSTSFQCVKGPTNRMPSMNSGGTVGGCDGVISTDWDLFQTNNPGSLGNPWSAGDKAFVQTWYRDPAAPKTTNLSDAVELTIQP